MSFRNGLIRSHYESVCRYAYTVVELPFALQLAHILYSREWTKLN